ncbi:CHAD domain-containing protein [Marinobacterium sediminicola]|uniref:CHAD domain-containing protein n=1 Tax=Marinobacterium sediminicola TaxID=518898 RepID=A0ABY1S4D2_9GAMM|nr:CHAD domain-containing protein [Marinobacterium sediminicola]ULG69198.1 CHAD domain-containing protein [Marinobacterium sediminicola]SMR78276.1 CHAD domain-containing protein [Marinobacterium sediminicola]
MSAVVNKSRQRILSADTTGQEVRHSASNLIAQTRERLNKGCSGPPDDYDEVVHQTRVDMKRLRSLWYLIQPGLSTQEAAKLHQSAQRVASSLSGARDLSVMLTTLGTLSTELSEDTLAAIQAEIRRCVDNAEVDRVALESACRMLDQMEHQLGAVDWSSLMRWHIAQRLTQTGRKSHVLYRRASRVADVDALHRWRKWVKVWMYQLQWLVPEASPAKKWMDLLKPLGSSLGNIHDVDILIELLGRMAEPQDRRIRMALVKDLQRQRQQNLIRVHELADRIYTKPPGRRCRNVIHQWLNVPREYRYCSL